MGVIGLVAVIVAALIHLWFFVLESLWFMRPAVYRRFSIESEADATVVRSFAFNQGFYNLFLAVGVAIGIALVALRNPAAGEAILLFACGSMIAAGVVLYLHNPRFLRAAAIQVVPPLIAVIAILAPR
jgi:putative membrane protein